MSKNWIRHISIVAEGAAGSLELSNMRCRVTTKQNTVSSPNLADIRITNLSPATAQPFMKKGEYSKITITAGYEDNYGVIFKGDIVQAVIGRENVTDTYLDLFARDGELWHNYAVVNKTFAAGSTPKDHYDEAIKSMVKFGAKAGYLGVDLSTPVYPRAVTLYGMARDVLRTICLSKNASWTTQNGDVHMVPIDKPLPGGAIDLNSMTGLVGMPSQTIGGIIFKCLVNPNIKVHGLVHVNQSSINQAALQRGIDGGIEYAAGTMPTIAADGIYKVHVIDVELDTRGNPWYQTLTCLANNSNIVPENLLLPHGQGQGPFQGT